MGLEGSGMSFSLSVEFLAFTVAEEEGGRERE